MTKTIKKYGIADAHGIESYNDGGDKNNAFLLIRANANRQRHAVVYFANMTKERDAKIRKFLDNQDFIGALNALKGGVMDGSADIQVAARGDAVKSFTLIPNPDLDPYHA